MFTATVRFVLRAAVVLPAFSCLVSACAGDGADGDGGGDALEIVGDYTDDFGGTHEITADTWTIDGAGVFHVLDFDNDTDYLVAQNDADNTYSPDLFSRFEWVENGDGLYLCQSVFDAESESAAHDAAGADPDDLETGCGGFPWSVLTPG
jgi:hypothetical protein